MKYHFCHIEIDGDTLILKAMDVYRNVFDEFMLDKTNKGPCNVGIEDFIQTKSNIYPNPSDGVFYVKVPYGERLSYRIFNSIGQLIAEVQDNSSNAGSVLIELTDQPSGIYYLEMKTTPQEGCFHFRRSAF